MAQPVKPFRLEDHVEVSKEFRLEDHIETPKAFDYTHLVETPKTGVSSLAEKFVRSHPIARALGMGPEDEKPASIGQMAEDYSARQAEQASPLVPGVPVRQDFVAKTRKDLLGGEEVTPELGVVKRTQEAVLADTEFPKKLDAVAGALEKGKVQDSERPQGMLDSLIGGMESTGRAVQAFGATVRGDEEKVLSLREEQQDVLRTPELESFYNEIQKRQAGLEEEDKTWTQAAKDVFGALQQNPEGGMHFLIEQLPNGLVPLATGAAGFAVGGLPGGITGLFGGNVALSAGFRALEEQAQEFSPEQQKDVLKKGAVEGGVITAVDVATLGLSHFILGATRRAVESATRQTVARLGRENGLELKDILKNPQLVNEVKMAQTRAFAATTSLGQRLTRGTAVVGLEGLGEGTGAYLGKLAADGEASKLEAVLEGFAGLAVGGIQGAALSAMQQKETAKLIDLTKTQTEAEQQVHVDMEESLQPEMVKETLEPILNEPMPEITPEELLEARKQQHRMETGVESILPDPEAVEDVVGLDELMLDPLYKSPGEWQTAVQDHMQKDLDAGISAIVARRRALEAFPEITPMTEKPITWSSVPAQVGLNLKQAKLAPGSVAIVGGFNEQFSPAYTQALGQTVDAWAKRFLGPKERIILNLSGLKGSAVGGYQQTPSGIHVISPRELVRTEISERFTNEGVMLSPSGFDGQGYNTFTQQQTFGALTHEFGHALGLAHFDNAMPEQFIGIVGKLDSGKIYTENQLAEMPQAEAAVVRDYQERKRRILANEMKADELIENWVGPWKLGKDLMKKQARDLYSYANEVLLREDKLFGTSHLSSTPLNQLSALDLIHAMGRETRTEVGMNAKGEPTTTRILPDENEIAESNRKAEAYYLQFSEFFAEQFSRYAHDKDIGKGTALGIYFRRALEVLRKFFQALKTPSGKSGEVVLKAGEAFNNWVDQLHVSKAMGEALAKQRKRNAQRFKARLERGLKEVKETVRQAPATLVKNLVQERKQKEEGVGEGNAVEDLEFLAEDTQAKEDLKTRIREAIPNVLDRDRADLMRLVGQGRLQEAEDQLADIVAERTKEARAWHGSPHDHDRFDSSKIGTGEGAQAYGYGHYFADNRGVAEYYQNILSARFTGDVNTPAGVMQWQEAIRRYWPKGQAPDTVIKILEAIEKRQGKVALANALNNDFIPELRLLNNIPKNHWEDFSLRGSGKLYEVELAPEQDEYLLWDKPLSEQSDKVKSALKGYFGPTESGRAIYEDLAGGRVTSEFARDASAYLHSLGIRGIKYLDGTSRAKGEGNYNYVIFDEVDIAIVAKMDRGYQDTPDGTKVEEIVSKIGSKEEASLWKKAVNFTAEAGYKLVQLQQLAHESIDYGLKAFVTYQNQMLALKNNLLQKGTEVAENWENLSRKQQKELDTLLMAELEKGEHFTELAQDQGTGKWQHSMGDRYRIFAKEQGIELTTPDGEKLADLIARLKNSILQHIQVSESIAVQIIRDKYAKAPLVAKQKEIEIRQNAQKWREAPYVPMGRYGNYFVKVFGKDSEGNRQLVYRTHFEDSASQDLLVKKLQKKGLDVAYGKVHEETALQLSLPTEFLSVLADSGEFNSEQLAKIGEMMMPLKSEKAFSKLARDADRIAGASADRLRDYANWIEDSSNFISKLAYGRKLTQARSITKRDMESAQGLGEVETAREKQRLLDTMSKAQEFMMHPLEEWYKARSVTALTFLMWAPKTALMNLTGLFQTWAAVTADYGDVKGNLAMGKATKDLMAGKLDYSDNWALDKALEDGLIDQGFGYFMSGLANAGNLARRVRPTVLGKAGRAFVDMGMWPFKAVELANRRLTLLTIFRAEKEKLKDTEMAPEEVMRTAYETASRYTRLLQNDYASGNRPEIMRGKKSIFMVFLSYPQYMLWIMSGGFERGTRLAALNAGGNPRSRFGGMTMRMWLIFLSLSGLEGLPFGKMLMDMLQGMWNKFGTGENIKVEAHRFMKESMGMEDRYWRDVVQRGFLHDVLGVDLSGSYSLGTPLPGTGLFDIQARNWQEFVGAAFGEFAGPFGGMVKAPAALGTDADGITMKDVGRAVPGFVGNIAKGIDAAQGGVTTSKGVRILKDEQGAYRDPTKAEIALIAGGFRLSTVANYQNLEKLKREQVDYWMGRRTGLKQQFRTAVKDKDPELRADVEEAIREFNKEIPNRGLHLSGKELMQFVRQNQRTIRKLEQNRYPEKQRGLMKDIDTLMN